MKLQPSRARRGRPKIPDGTAKGSRVRVLGKWVPCVSPGCRVAEAKA